MTGATSATRRRLASGTGRSGRRRPGPAALRPAVDAICVLAVALLVGHGEPAVLVFSGAVLVVHVVAGLYRRRPDPRLVDELPRVLGAALAGVGVAAIAHGAFAVGAVDGTVLRAVLVQTVLLSLTRTAGHVIRRIGSAAHDPTT